MTDVESATPLQLEEHHAHIRRRARLYGRPERAERIAPPPPGPGFWRKIVAQVAAKHRITAEEILSDCKEAYLSLPRFEAYYRVAILTGLNPTAVGRLFHRERKTIKHGIAMFKASQAEASV